MIKSTRFPSNWRTIAAATFLATLALLLLGIQAGAAGSEDRKVSVKIDGLAYHPPTLRVDRGTRVVFANRDSTAHTATGKGFNTRVLAPGKAVVVRFNQKGTFSYHCQIHPFMKGKIVVH
ncbi:MAG TPA: cupredoxin domain-containing protein [Solirubrobacterales bacterium]|nr:cupredoxin domain-containing protein [Solirubrobacterales bacterium]